MALYFALRIKDGALDYHTVVNHETYSRYKEQIDDYLSGFGYEIPAKVVETVE